MVVRRAVRRLVAFVPSDLGFVRWFRRPWLIAGLRWLVSTASPVALVDFPSPRCWSSLDRITPSRTARCAGSVRLRPRIRSETTRVGYSAGPLVPFHQCQLELIHDL